MLHSSLVRVLANRLDSSMLLQWSVLTARAAQAVPSRGLTLWVFTAACCLSRLTALCGLFLRTLCRPFYRCRLPLAVLSQFFWVVAASVTVGRTTLTRFR